jgi:hypothetical protein
MQGLTPQQVQERITRSRQLQAQQAARGIVVPDAEQEEKISRFMDRHGYNPTIGMTDQDPSGAITPPVPREPGKPWRP